MVNFTFQTQSYIVLNPRNQELSSFSQKLEIVVHLTHMDMESYKCYHLIYIQRDNDSTTPVTEYMFGMFVFFHHKFHHCFFSQHDSEKTFVTGRSPINLTLYIRECYLAEFQIQSNLNFYQGGRKSNST